MYWITFDTAGVLQEVRSLTCPEPAPGYHDVIAGLLRAHARLVHVTRKATGLTVWLRSGPSARIEVARRVREHSPELANMSAVGDTVNRVARRLQQQFPALKGRLADVTVEFRINEEGVPGQSRILTPLGIAPIEDAVHAVVRSMRFRPATINRCPVPAHVTLPIILQFDR